jgi:glycosyltransferase involved in cell wall biosynthesis
MTSEILTAIVPVGPLHLLENRVNSWIQDANLFTSQLKVILVQDIPEQFDSLEQLKDKYKDLRNCDVIQGNFGGPGAARNYAIEMSSTPWLCFWDSDDVPNIGAIIDSVEKANNEKLQVVIGAFRRLDPLSKIVKDSNSEVSLSSVAKDPGIWRMAFNTEIIGGKRFANIRMAEDQVFLFDLDLESKDIYFTKNCLYTYITSGINQLTANKVALNDLDFAIDEIIQRIRFRKDLLDNFSICIVANIFRASIKNSSLRFKLGAVRKIFILLSVLPASRAALILRFLGISPILSK